MNEGKDTGCMKQKLLDMLSDSGSISLHVTESKMVPDKAYVLYDSMDTQGVYYNEDCKNAINELCLEGRLVEEEGPNNENLRQRTYMFPHKSISEGFFDSFKPMKYYHIVREIQESGMPGEIIEVIELKVDVGTRTELAKANKICVEKLIEQYPTDNYIIQLRASRAKVQKLWELKGYFPVALKKGKIKASTCLDEWNVEYAIEKCKKQQPIKEQTELAPFLKIVMGYAQHLDKKHLLNKYTNHVEAAELFANADDENIGGQTLDRLSNCIFDFGAEICFLSDKDLEQILLNDHKFPEVIAQDFIKDTKVIREYNRWVKPAGCLWFLAEIFFPKLGNRIYKGIEKKYNKNFKK